MLSPETEVAPVSTNFGIDSLPLLRAAIQKDLGITLPESRSHAVA